jgi:hypothetical protein
MSSMLSLIACSLRWSKRFNLVNSCSCTHRTDDELRIRNTIPVSSRERPPFVARKRSSLMSNKRFPNPQNGPFCRDETNNGSICSCLYSSTVYFNMETNNQDTRAPIICNWRASPKVFQHAILRFGEN